MYRPPEWNRAYGARHKTPAPRARLLLACLVGWFLERQFILVGDTGYGTSATARFCRQHGRHLVLRLTPCWFGLYTMVVLHYLQLPRSSRAFGALFWRRKSSVTFSDRMACVRRALWEPWCFHIQVEAQAFSKLPQSLWEMILYALAPAA